MSDNEKRRLTLNRIVSFLAGGLLVFAVMSVTVVKNVRSQNAELTTALDTSRYEAGRLLADANAQLASRDFVKARASLTSLFENQPGSPEAAQGTLLLVTVDSAEKAADAKWAAAAAGVQAKWSSSVSADILAKSDAERAQIEKDMKETLTQQWAKEKDKVRADWEAQS
ncbi:MAG TPA: hypothetical protein VMW87_12620 [Spirochaetia bacterium]|nr:hypothetical protein [Spirochaetia bacterium]